MNNINLNRKRISKEGILEYIEDIDVYRFYSGKEVIINRSISSPLREDKSPSFGYYIKNNEILFKDFTLGSGGDFVRFVMLMNGLSKFEALSQIAIDFDLSGNFFHKQIKVSTTKKYNPKDYESRNDLIANAPESILKKKGRRWAIKDFKFWDRFGIRAITLKKFNVEPLEYIFINDKIIKADNLAYTYSENKEGYESYKIYQPYSKTMKWLNNHNNSVWQGWTQLPEEGNTVIITTSLKDVMSIDAVLGIPSVALQSENVMPKDNVVNQLRGRFKEVIVLYDNDYDSNENWGERFGSKLTSEFGLIQYRIPSEYKCKDFSDLVEKLGTEESARIYEDEIKLPF